MVKALALISGGLDSILAARVIKDQGLDVIGFTATSIFYIYKSGKGTEISSKEACRQLDIQFKTVDITQDLIEIIKSPRYGFGKNLNPCIDCRILIVKKAKEYMDEIGAQFLVTGEVLGERPFSQRREAFRIVEKESGMGRLILRPLSARLLLTTIPEEKRLVKRELLLDIRGKSRKRQIELADTFGIRDYPTPAGGCLLTDREFSLRMKDLLRFNPGFVKRDVELNKFGRHFRLSPGFKIIVGRDRNENAILENLKDNHSFIFVPEDVKGPIGIGEGIPATDDIVKSSKLIARYSDAPRDNKVKVICKSPSGEVLAINEVRSLDESHIEGLRVAQKY